jgi:hypothetical protein
VSDAVVVDGWGGRPVTAAGRARVARARPRWRQRDKGGFAASEGGVIAGTALRFVFIAVGTSRAFAEDANAEAVHSIGPASLEAS